MAVPEPGLEKKGLSGLSLDVGGNDLGGADLKVPPGNRLERLKGERKGQYSIRINRQWRIIFIWESDNVFEVEIVDYH